MVQFIIAENYVIFLLILIEKYYFFDQLQSNIEI